MVVVAPEHRDGSAPVSYIAKDTPEYGSKIQEYTKYSHTPSDEVWKARDSQLKIRLWELNLLVEALAKIDCGAALKNLCVASTTPEDALTWFRQIFDIETPGKVIFAGHSFGACTTLQLVKSVYWANNEHPPEVAELDHGAPTQTQLFTPRPDATISHLITPTTPTILLDMWTLPLRSPFTQSLANLPMPHFTPENPNGGDAILSVLSSAFAAWKDNMEGHQRALADPYAVVPAKAAPMANGPLKNPYLSNLIRADADSASDSGYESETASEAPSSPASSVCHDKPRQKAHVFYPLRSAHLSQSDYGVLFPTITKYLAKGQEPQRTIVLNVRATLEVLRRSGIEVRPKLGMPTIDDRILSTQAGLVRGWVSVNADAEGEGEVEEAAAIDPSTKNDPLTGEAAQPDQAANGILQKFARYGGKV